MMTVPSKCPKCSVGQLLGPRYERIPNELKWTCGTCGYVRRTKPMHQLQEATVEELLAAQRREV